MILKKSKIFKTRLYKHIYIRKKVSFIKNDIDLPCNGCDFMESGDKCNYLWPCKIASLVIEIRNDIYMYYVYQPIS
jgi:hypothetical protein